MGCVVHTQPMSNPIEYSERIDPVIYGDAARKLTPDEWLIVAMAAMDQAGLSPEVQDRIAEELGTETALPLHILQKVEEAHARDADTVENIKLRQAMGGWGEALS